MASILMRAPGSHTANRELLRSVQPISRPERIIIDLVLLILCWGFAGLGLALVGWFEGWSTVLITVVLWGAIRRLVPRATPGFDAWWIAAFSLAVSVVVLNAAFPAEHLFTGRDSGTYLATAGWLARDGSLMVDVSAGPLGQHPGLHFIVPGFYDIGVDRVLEPQFMHAYPSMLATLIDIGGLRAALLLNPFIGAVCLLGLFGLARRYVRPPLALLTMLVLGTSMVFVYFSRATFTELFMAVFVLTGIWMTSVAEEQSDRRLALVAGAMLGAATLVRLDGIVLLVPVTGYLLLKGTLTKHATEVGGRVRQAMFAVALVGLGEVLLVAPAYILDRRDQVLPVLIALLVVLLTHRILQHRIGAIAAWVAINRRAVFSLCAGALVILVAYGWLVRPLVSESTGNAYGLESIQQREGIEVDPDRTYAELSMQWVTWYQGGAFLLLAALGCVALMRDIASGRSTRDRDWLLLLVFVTFSALYFWRPSVNPDHIWAMRRYLTVVLPLGTVLAAIAVDRAAMLTYQRLGKRPGEWIAGGVLSMSLLAPTAAATAPVWDVAELSGAASQFTEACGELGSDTHILFVDDESGAFGHRFAQSFRSYCGFPAAWGGAELTREEMTELADQVARSGGRLVTIGPVGDQDRRLFEAPFPALELTLTSAPKTISLVDMSLSWGEVGS